MSERNGRTSVTALVMQALFAVSIVALALLFEAKTSTLRNLIAPHVLPSQSAGEQYVLSLTSEGVGVVNRFTAAHPQVDVVAIVAVDLEDNTRTPLIVRYNDRALEQLAAKYVQLPTIIPLFTDDKANNADLSALLNGEFSCKSAAEGMPLVLPAQIKSKLKTTCRVPVPPFYGRLAGYVVIYSTRELSIYEVESLRISTIRLSVDLYYAAPAPKSSAVLTLGVNQ